MTQPLEEFCINAKCPTLTKRLKKNITIILQKYFSDPGNKMISEQIDKTYLLVVK
jgi:hypothetical protein